MPRRWFYLDDDHAHGPLREADVRSRLRMGDLAPDTRVWHDGADGWHPLQQVLERVRREGRPEAGHPSWGRGQDGHHPVRRYLARLVDIGAFGLLGMAVLLLMLYALFPELGVRFTAALDSTPGRTLDLVLTVVLSSLIAAIPLGLTGSTLGKWLFGIQVLDDDGQPLGVRRAVGREMRVLVQGLAFGLPVISLLALGLAYRRLGRRGRTHWDEAMDLRVRYRPLSGVQMALGIIGLLSIAALFWMQRG